MHFAKATKLPKAAVAQSAENLFLKPVPHWHASGDKEAYEIVFGAYNYFDTELFVEHFKECCKGKKWSLFLQFEGDGYRVVAEGVDVAI